MRNAKLFAGTSHLALAQRVATHLGMELAPVNLRRYTNRETTVDLGCSVRQKDVYILQSGSTTTNDHLMEVLIMVSAAKLASARKITVVVPYFPYSKQSKRKKRRGAISGKLVANMMTVAGVDHIITMDLHASQMSGFFTIPVDNLFSEPTIGRWLMEHVVKAKDGDNGGIGIVDGPKDIVVVAKNAGGAKRVTALADRLGSGFALIHTDNAPTTRPFSRTPSTVALHTLPQTPLGPGMYADAINALPINAARPHSPSPLQKSGNKKGSQIDLDLKTIPTNTGGSAAPATGDGAKSDEGKGEKEEKEAEEKTDDVAAVTRSMQRASFQMSPIMSSDQPHESDEPSSIEGITTPPSGLEISEVLNRSDDDDDDDIDEASLMEMVNTPMEELASPNDATVAHNAQAIAQASAGISEQKRARTPGAIPSHVLTPGRPAAVPLEHTQPSGVSRRSTGVSSYTNIQRITSGTHLQADPPLRPPVAVTSWHKKRNARITLVGDVRNKLALLLDDMIDHPSSFLTAAEHLMVNCGARAVYIVAAHGLFSGSSLGEVEICPYVHKVIVTNTFPIPEELTSASTKLIQIDVAPVLAEAIRRNHNGESISYLFDRNPW
ncbi:ribose-phosphate pyrophosphokinase 1 [Dipsacomyces acuminosporus]|nr:ribose-phosphate pyrophosphokinase 1 [Dipsacomyces acuminosporus]